MNKLKTGIIFTIYTPICLVCISYILVRCLIDDEYCDAIMKKGSYGPMIGGGD